MFKKGKKKVKVEDIEVKDAVEIKSKVSERVSKEELSEINVNILYKKEKALNNVFKDIKDYISALEDRKLKGNTTPIKDLKVKFGGLSKYFLVNADLEKGVYTFKEL